MLLHSSLSLFFALVLFGASVRIEDEIERIALICIGCLFVCISLFFTAAPVEALILIAFAAYTFRRIL